MANISQSASDARKKEYIAKYGALPSGVTLSTEKPAPAAPKVSLSSRTYTGEKPSTRSTPSNNSSTPSKTTTPAPGKTTAASATATAEKTMPKTGTNNGDTFLSIIGSMPVETRNRYLSAYTDFLALPQDQQDKYLSALDQQAKDIVAPKIEQDRTRLKEDFNYEVEKRNREKADLQSTFDQAVGYLTTNKNRDIAKQNKTAAQVLQNIGNTAFVTGIAGSGIFSRRSYYARENLQDNTDDINIDYSQKTNELGLKKSQADRTIDDEVNRLYQLNARDVSDLDQTQKEDELAMFFELAGNAFGQKGEQNAALLEAGAGGSAEKDFAAGGTDSQRKARDTKEKTTARLDAQRAREDQAVTRYKQLYDLSKALETMGRNAELPGIRAEMSRLEPFVGTVLDEARNGYASGEYQSNGYSPRSFFGSSGSGIGSLDDWRRRWDTSFNEQNNLLYKGMNEEARTKINKFLQDNADTIRMYQSS